MDSEKDSQVRQFKWHIIVIAATLAAVAFLALFTKTFDEFETVRQLVWLLGGLIFLWTPAHFYNLALAYKEDYARGGFPMMPVVRGNAVTRKHITLYFAATLSTAVVLTAITDLGPLYALASVGLGAIFLWAIVRLHWERTESAAMRAFHASNAYLGIVLVTIVVDAMVV